jgi:putative hydrolase of the HAD superfamily
MSISTLFIDLDDTLYPPTSGVWSLIRQRIDLYIHERLAVPWAQVQELRRTLFEQYGTTMRGLQACYHIDEADYLAFVHDVPVETLIQPDPLLRRVLEQYSQRKVIFTNADVNHANRVIRALGFDGLFDQIIDICAISPHCKPQLPAFHIALSLADESDPGRCLLADDTPANIKAALEFGFQAVLVGSPHPDDGHYPSIPRLHDLPMILATNLSSL